MSFELLADGTLLADEREYMDEAIQCFERMGVSKLIIVKLKEEDPLTFRGSIDNLEQALNALRGYLSRMVQPATIRGSLRLPYGSKGYRYYRKANARYG